MRSYERTRGFPLDPKTSAPGRAAWRVQARRRTASECPSGMDRRSAWRKSAPRHIPAQSDIDGQAACEFDIVLNPGSEILPAIVWLHQVHHLARGRSAE